MTDVVVEYIKRVFVELFLVDFPNEQLDEMFTVVNERLQQRFVQSISLQATNHITFYNTEWAKKLDHVSVCQLMCTMTQERRSTYQNVQHIIWRKADAFNFIGIKGQLQRKFFLFQ